MKLALKLAVAVLPGALVIIAAAAFLELRRDRAEFDADQRSDDLEIARVLARNVGRMWEAGGEDRALAMVADLRGVEARLRVRWIDLRDEPMGTLAGSPNPPATGSARQNRATRTRAAGLSPPEREALARGEEVPWLPPGDAAGWYHVMSPVRAHGTMIGAIDVAEAPPDLRAHVRRAIRATVVTNLALGATMLLVTLLVGAWVVGRPISALIGQARRVAAGDLGARSTPRQRDELGELTRELNGMLDRLEAAAAEVRASTQQRFATLEQLRHAERLTTVGRLASSVAHELGTPLSVVAGRARLVIEDGREAPAHARIIIDQAERMTKIIRQLLDYARRKPPQKEAQDLTAVVRDVLSLLDPLASKRRVALRFAAEVKEAPVVADSTQVQQALANLVVNAIQASAEGGAIDVSLRAAPGARRTRGAHADEIERDGFEVSVRDHGPGMSAEVLARVFEPFFTTKPVGEATGLGLSVANDILDEHGGWMEAESEPGRGSRFSMFLPRRGT